MSNDEMAGLDSFFSRRMKLGGIGAAPVSREIAATADECAALAANFNLPALAMLAGDFTITHVRGGIMQLDLRLNARLTQICVVTLEPFETKLQENARLHLVPQARLQARLDAQDEGDLVDAESLEGPDEIPYDGESVDLGALLAEQLALALDPYPRKPGASLPEGYESSEESPFAALLAFKKPGA